MKPNRTQVEAAKLVVAQYGRDYRNAGTDQHQNTAVMAIFAILTGRKDNIPAEYRRFAAGVEFPSVSDSATKIESLEFQIRDLTSRLDESRLLVEKLSTQLRELESKSTTERVNLEAMTVEELRAFADQNNVDLTGISKKANIVAALREFGF